LKANMLGNKIGKCDYKYIAYTYRMHLYIMAYFKALQVIGAQGCKSCCKLPVDSRSVSMQTTPKNQVSQTDRETVRKKPLASEYIKSYSAQMKSFCATSVSVAGNNINSNNKWQPCLRLRVAFTHDFDFDLFAKLTRTELCTLRVSAFAWNI